MVKKILFFILFVPFFGFQVVYAQNDSIPSDDGPIKSPLEDNISLEKDSTETSDEGTSSSGEGIESTDDDLKTKGVSVSPAHFHLTQKPGESKTYQINVKNDTPEPKQFRVSVYDFNMDGKGKTSFLPPGQGDFSLSAWMNVTPTFFEIAPGEKRKINFNVDIPNDTSAKRAAWSIIMVEQEEPKKTLEPPQRDDGTVAMAVIPTFAFGVFVYQNSPTLVADNIEITNFSFQSQDTTQSIFIETKNAGNGIAYCTSYIDLTHLDSGKQQRLPVKRFTTLPGLVRDFVFVLPKQLPRGNYLAIGVLDYEKAEEIQAAKMTFKLE